MIGGYAREFFRRAGVIYKQPMAWTFEPKVAEKILNDWLREAGVEVIFEQRLSDVSKKENQITSIKMENGLAYSTKVYIDATYEGDLMARAKVAYTVGREARSKYKEALAGVTGNKFLTSSTYRIKVSL